MSRDNENTNMQQGMAAVEFAMVLPFLVALLITTVEFGRMYYSYQRLHMAAFDAARYISARLPSSGLFNLENLKANLENELRIQARQVAVYGIANSKGDPVLPGLSENQVHMNFNALEAVQNSNTSTSRQSLCRVRAYLESYNILSELVDQINGERYCNEIDGNLMVQIDYTYQPIFNEIPLLGLDLSIPMQAQASMRVF
ncbi:pilus assembly protein [Thalassotalea sp. G20_0]|uniref:TadE family protein n=1 Tax=Thalassotalea sp. G20_0 TaxID=2821093 RepID=UPI001ADCB0BA|nr:TadE family protein [Thalassotalea sp. G20_0]MBO9493965.1 pilus assembly protein [Thalassotalea sp. G20_0]